MLRCLADSVAVCMSELKQVSSVSVYV